MQIREKVAVITGGASGIGEGLCRRFAQEGARGVVIADRDAAGLERVARETGALAHLCDVSREPEVVAAIARAREAFGRVDAYCSNAGIFLGGPVAALATAHSNDDWRRIWEINVMAHIYAARALLPEWIARGEGHFLVTASAAGLLSQIGDAAYSATKHAAIGFAEALAIAHGDDGVRVYCLCPQGVATAMTAGQGDSPQSRDGMLQPAEVAEHVIRAFAEERFLILPHPQVLTYMQRKASDYQRWLSGMRRLRRSFLA